MVASLLLSSACTNDREPDAFVRIDQVGYVIGESKIAFLLSPRDAAGARADVVDAGGAKVLSLDVGDSRGSWNAAFPDVRPIDLTALTRPGTYRLRVEGVVTAQSPAFRVGTAGDLFGPLARDAVAYFQAHRDGPDQVNGTWHRQPAHLADEAATVYESPDFDEDDRISDELQPVDGPVDVEGGWYDAGDYLKFTHTTAYALTAMLIVQRDGMAPDGLAPEIRHGLNWLDKMWDADTATLYTQVGIGSGDGDFLGDHDTWRLPQDDDQLAVQPGDEQYFQRYRPVFRAAEPGEPISPNLAGRVAAAFALAAQVEADGDPARARSYLTAAAEVFDMAETDDVDNLVTSEPRSYYPEDTWRDDLALGATELALAGRLLDDSRTASWLQQANHWSRANAADDGDAVLSVYNLGALADAELARALTAIPTSGTEADTARLRQNLQRRLDRGAKVASGNPLGAAAGYGGFDYAAQELGYTATAELYARIFKDGRYAAFATAQRDVVLGANGWGTSMIVGAGSTYPHCPHDQIATLTAQPTDRTDMAGAVINGPNAADRVDELLDEPPPLPCSNDAFTRFDRDDTHYVDDIRVSATNEAAIDFTATGLLALALTAQPH